MANTLHPLLETETGHELHDSKFRNFPSAIRTEEATEAIQMTGNVVAGVEGNVRKNVFNCIEIFQFSIIFVLIFLGHNRNIASEDGHLAEEISLPPGGVLLKR